MLIAAKDIPNLQFEPEYQRGRRMFATFAVCSIGLKFKIGNNGHRHV